MGKKCHHTLQVGYNIPNSFVLVSFKLEIKKEGGYHCTSSTTLSGHANMWE